MLSTSTNLHQSPPISTNLRPPPLVLAFPPHAVRQAEAPNPNLFKEDTEGRGVGSDPQDPRSLGEFRQLLKQLTAIAAKKGIKLPVEERHQKVKKKAHHAPAAAPAAEPPAPAPAPEPEPPPPPVAVEPVDEQPPTFGQLAQVSIVRRACRYYDCLCVCSTRHGHS